MAAMLDWVGGKHSFFAAGSWAPMERPHSGDTLTIGYGTASAPNIAIVHDRVLSHLTVLLDDGPGGIGSPFVPTLSLSNAMIGPGTLIENLGNPQFGASDTEAILVNGWVLNFGTIAENPGSAIGNTLDITIRPHGILFNGMTGVISGTTISNLNIAGGCGSILINDGTVSGNGTIMDIAVPVTGLGVFNMSQGGNPFSHTGVPSTLEFHHGVGARETIAVNDTTLILDAPLAFLATIDDLSVTPSSAFATDSSVILKGEHVTSLTFNNNILTAQNGQQTLASLHFSAGLSADDFVLTDTSAGSRIGIVAPSPAAASPQVLSNTDLVPALLASHS